MSSLRTYIDPTRGIASPSGEPDIEQSSVAAFPATGLFSNIAFSNFYSSSADESDIEAALVTARKNYNSSGHLRRQLEEA